MADVAAAGEFVFRTYAAKAAVAIVSEELSDNKKEDSFNVFYNDINSIVYSLVLK